MIKAACELCGHEQMVHQFDDYACAGCGQMYEYDEGHGIVLDAAQRALLLEARTGRPVARAGGVYTDEERAALGGAAAERVRRRLPPDVGFVVVLATRTENDRSRFVHVGNLPMRDAARLLTRAAYNASPEGLDDVLASMIADRSRTKGEDRN